MTIGRFLCSTWPSTSTNSLLTSCSEAAFHKNLNPRDQRWHITARGYKTDDGSCWWGIHVFEDGSFTVKNVRGNLDGTRRRLDQVDWEQVWAESKVSLTLQLSRSILIFSSNRRIECKDRNDTKQCIEYLVVQKAKDWMTHFSNLINVTSVNDISE